MIERYSRKEIKSIWEDKNKYTIWLKIEIAAAEAMEKFKIIPKGVSKKVKSKAKIDVKRILKIEDKRSTHDYETNTRTWTTTTSYEIQGLHSDGKFNYDATGQTQTIDGYETLFNQDLNNDGKLGIDTTNLTNITTDTTLSLIHI